jgi:tetratricopeptide (TPR) repeat protein
MNKNQFIEFLQRPEKLGNSEAQMLEKVIEEFPYCQAAHVLHLKALHNEKHINYNSRLKITAAYTSERKMLYRFIMQGELKKKISKAESEIEEKPEVKIIPVIGDPKPALEHKVIIPAPEIIIPEKQEEIISKAQLAEMQINKSALHKPPLIIEVKSLSEPEKIKPEAVKEEISETSGLTDLEQEILKEAVNAVIEIELTNSEITSLPIGAPENLSIKAKETDSALIAPDKQNEDILLSNVHSLPDKETKLSFTDWLKRLKNTETSQEIKEEEKTLEESIELLVEKDNKKPEEKPDAIDLIEKFIKEEPRIKPKKAEFFSPVNMARMSMVEKDDFVTETLANIYAKQGNTQKAIKAYENLILKYPQKTAYFAAQIKELKEKN